MPMMYLSRHAHFSVSVLVVPGRANQDPVQCTATRNEMVLRRSVEMRESYQSLLNFVARPDT